MKFFFRFAFHNVMEGEKSAERLFRKVYIDPSSKDNEGGPKKLSYRRRSKGIQSKLFYNFPEFKKFLSEVSFIYKDPESPEITTFVFGNNSLTPLDFVHFEEGSIKKLQFGLGEPAYHLNKEDFCEMILNSFMLFYKNFFISNGFFDEYPSLEVFLQFGEAAKILDSIALKHNNIVTTEFLVKRFDTLWASIEDRGFFIRMLKRNPHLIPEALHFEEHIKFINHRQLKNRLYLQLISKGTITLLESFFSAYDLKQAPFLFKRMDDITKYFFIRNFFKVDSFFSGDVLAIVHTLFDDSIAGHAKLSDIFSKETFDFIFQGLQRSQVECSLDIDKNFLLL